MSCTAIAPLPSKSEGQALHVVGEHALPKPSKRSPCEVQSSWPRTVQWPVHRLQHAPVVTSLSPSVPTPEDVFTPS